jgi:hypothetical protein
MEDAVVEEPRAGASGEVPTGGDADISIEEPPLDEGMTEEELMEFIQGGGGELPGTSQPEAQGREQPEEGEIDEPAVPVVSGGLLQADSRYQRLRASIVERASVGRGSYNVAAAEEQARLQNLSTGRGRLQGRDKPAPF